jgi:hypothetical protein
VNARVVSAEVGKDKLKEGVNDESFVDIAESFDIQRVLP